MWCACSQPRENRQRDASRNPLHLYDIVHAFAEAHQNWIILMLNAVNQGVNVLFSVADLSYFLIVIIFLGLF